MMTDVSIVPELDVTTPPSLLYAYLLQCGLFPQAAEQVVCLVDRLTLAAEAVQLAEAEELTWRSKPRCNGVEHWPQSLPHNGEYLFANHGTGIECPLHGRHPNGDRLRKGIGRSREAQHHVREAIRNFTIWIQKQDDLHAKRRTLTLLQQRVQAVADGRF